MTFREHQAKAGRSRSPKKLKALAKARKLAAKARRSANPSPAALYQRKRRARLKREKEYAARCPICIELKKQAVPSRS